MRVVTFVSPMVVVSLAALIGCSGGDRALGAPCSNHDDCDSTLQCIESTCVARCLRAPECGDGFACDDRGICRPGESQRGDTCSSEVDCAPGLSCQIDDVATDADGHLLASCTTPNLGRPAGASCERDDECRNGTCALGRCVDLCAATRDCAPGTACMVVPRGSVARADAALVRPWALFEGCLPARGTITFPIEVGSARKNDIAFPVPSGAQHASIVMTVNDPAQRVGVTRVRSPNLVELYCRGAECALPARRDEEPVWHESGFGQSVLAMPSNPDVPLETGMYSVDIAAVRADTSPGTAIPRATGVLRLDAAEILDLHFYFLNLADHPCRAALGGLTLDAESAASEAFFQSELLGALRSILTSGGIALGGITYENIPDRPQFDGLRVADAAGLLQLGAHAGGINVFFVRTLSPVGLQGFAPGPGPGGLAGTRQSGVIIGLDTVCYRSWAELARLAAHEMARYMGLYRNADVSSDYADPIADSPRAGEPGAEENLMFYSELGGGAALSPGQRDILLRSPVLR